MMIDDWLMEEDQWLVWMADKPILRRLYEERVFSLGFLANGNLGVTENCDGYFCEELSLSDLSNLIEELAAIRAEMIARTETKEGDT